MYSTLSWWNNNAEKIILPQEFQHLLQFFKPYMNLLNERYKKGVIKLCTILTSAVPFTCRDSSLWFNFPLSCFTTRGSCWLVQPTKERKKNSSLRAYAHYSRLRYYLTKRDLELATWENSEMCKQCMMDVSWYIW